jgi:uncharacterized membrane protein (DUF4010 family)
MNAPENEMDAAIRLAIALLVGAGVGLEREWSGHSSGPGARFAGLRTFLLLGVAGGVAGLLAGDSPAIAAVIVAGSIALSIAAYVLASSRPEGEIGGTTEAAAVVVVALGVLAGQGFLALAAGIGAVVVLALREKARLHWLVRRMSEDELRATLQFAVLALVILPILPEGPFGGALGFQPRAVWILVLLFSGINFGAYLVRRALGPHSGYIATGLAGGLVSSTAVTLAFARRSRREESFAPALAFGAIGACIVLIPRVIVISAILDTAVAWQLARILAVPALAGAAIVGFAWRNRALRAADVDEQEGVRNPLRLGAAVQMALAFQVSLTVLTFVRDRWGSGGVFATATLLGLTDVDALTMSMSRLDGPATAALAAQAIGAGILANTALKFVLSVILGAPAFRRIAGLGLAALGVATALSLFVSLS